MSKPAPIPWTAPLIQLDAQGQRPLPGYSMSKEFGNWFQTSLVQGVTNAPQFLPAVSLIAQNAAIATTPIPLPSLAAGPYRVTWYTEITAADGGGSALQITVTWTHNGKTLSLSGANLTSDSITTVQSNSVTVLIDAASPLSYSVAYSSTTPGKMQYQLFILPEIA